MDENKPIAHAFGKEVCRGDRDAEVFCHLFYRYAHFCDDCLDMREDGRPILTPEQTIEGFIIQAQMFNCPFWRKHGDLLLGCLLSVTNQWADSVKWERDPKDHLRGMADVLRMAGDDMFALVAVITGGWQHARNLSPRIRETDFLRQHTKPDDFF